MEEKADGGVGILNLKNIDPNCDATNLDVTERFP